MSIFNDFFNHPQISMIFNNFMKNLTNYLFNLTPSKKNKIKIKKSNIFFKCRKLKFSKVYKIIYVFLNINMGIFQKLDQIK